MFENIDTVGDKMVERKLDLIVLQDELPIILTDTITLETHIKGHHVYKDIWTPKQGEYLDVRCEPENLVDKYAVCVKNGNETIVGHLKKGKTGRFAKTIFYFLRSHPEAKCTAKVTGKRCNLGDGEGLQVPCSLHITGLKKCVSVLTQQLDLMKEKY